MSASFSRGYPTVEQLDTGSANFDLLCGALMAFGEKLMLTYERAAGLLRYDSNTGKLHWAEKPSKHASINVGDEAGTLHRDPTNTYRGIQIDGAEYKSHRIVWLLHHGVWPDNQIDHIDGNGLNNRVENLRDVSRQENLKNKRMYRTNASGITGVCWHKAVGKWYAQIRVDGKQKSLGYFTDVNDAAAAYRKAADDFGYTERHGVAV